MKAMKILTFWQPWASLAAYYLKGFDTRDWAAVDSEGKPYRGKLLIHASQRPIDQKGVLLWHRALFIAQSYGIDVSELPSVEELPLGALIAIANLTQCSEITRLPAVNPPWYQISLNTTCSGLRLLELICGRWEEGRFAWKLENVERITPIAYPDQRRLVDATPECIRLVHQARFAA